MIAEMLDEEEPETLAIVETALRPMVTMRVSRSSGAAEKPAAGEDAELLADPEGDLEKVLAEAQAELEQQG